MRQDASSVSKTAFIYHPDYVHHETPSFHPERPERITTVYEFIKNSDLAASLSWLRPQPAAIRWIEGIHTPQYRRRVQEACQQQAFNSFDFSDFFDSGDTAIGRHSYTTALLATGGALLAVDTVLRDDCTHAFCAVRPPGHHACRERAMGFCLFNSIAVAARYAQKQYGLQRILIIDWDVHHGNGTQESFYADDSVLFFSIHQSPLYPGTGAAEETGSGKGKGFTINAPIPAGSTIATYRKVFVETLFPLARRFCPELILISAGFDAHRQDPLAQVCLDAADFSTLTVLVQALAQELCCGCMVSLLEGGYHLRALSHSVYAHLSALAQKPLDSKIHSPSLTLQKG